MENQPITTELVNKLISTVNAGLCSGLGNPTPGEMCVEAAVCYAYGIPHNDNPPCVGSSIRSFKIRLNDSSWSSNQARAKGMLSLSIAQLNSNFLDQQEFSKRITLKIISNIIADLAKTYLPGIENDIRTVKDLATARELCTKLRRNSSAYVAYAIDYARAAADLYSTAYEPEFAAGNAANTAGNAAFAAVAASYSAANYAAGDVILTQAADLCLDVLKEMESPGCEYLYLINH